jgi:DNA-binding MarR family transcriptional regulator
MNPGLLFQFFNEIGIINQLSTARLNKLLPDGLHVSHFSVLNHLHRLGDGVTPLKIANAFQVTKATMTHTIKVLSERGLVRLEPHETDGRSKLVFLTDEGRHFRENAIAQLGPSTARLMDLLDLEQMSEMLPKLQEIRKILDDNREL